MTRNYLPNLVPGDEKELLGVCNWEQSDLVACFFKKTKRIMFIQVLLLPIPPTTVNLSNP